MEEQRKHAIPSSEAHERGYSQTLRNYLGMFHCSIAIDFWPVDVDWF
jgi:hypothetical protein